MVDKFAKPMAASREVTYAFHFSFGEFWFCYEIFSALSLEKHRCSLCRLNVLLSRSGLMTLPFGYRFPLNMLNSYSFGGTGLLPFSNALP